MLSDSDKSRILSKYRRLKGRSVDLSYAPVGPEVQAGTPEELQRETDRALIAEAEKSGTN